MSADDFVLVDCAFAQFGNENFPDARRAAGAHGADASIPAIEVANQTDAARARSPNGEVCSAHAFERSQMRAEFFVGVVVATFAHQMQIELAEQIGKGVGVKGFDGFAVARAIANAIRGRRWQPLLRIGKRDFKKAFRAHPTRRERF